MASSPFLGHWLINLYIYALTSPRSRALGSFPLRPFYQRDQTFPQRNVHAVLCKAKQTLTLILPFRIVLVLGNDGVPSRKTNSYRVGRRTAGHVSCFCAVSFHPNAHGVLRELQPLTLNIDRRLGCVCLTGTSRL